MNERTRLPTTGSGLEKPLRALRSRLLLALLPLLIASSPAGAEQTIPLPSGGGGEGYAYEPVDSPYPLLDSGFLANYRERTFWLDDHRVLFVGWDEPKPRTLQEPRLGRPGIFIWDTRTNEVTPYRKGILDHLCYEDGWIYYRLSRTAPFTHAAGPLGQEATASFENVEEYKAFAREQFFSPTTCRFHRYADYVDDAKNVRIIPLGDSGAFLHVDMHARRSGEVHYLSGKGAQKQLLPFTTRDFSSGSVVYYTHSKQYFLKPVTYLSTSMEQWKNTGCLEGWWFDKKGFIKSFCIPSGPWLTPAGVTFTDTLKGLAIASEYVHERIPTPGGLYLLENLNFIRLNDGWVNALSTSPNGCRIAFTYAPNLEARAYGAGNGITSLQMVDFCN